MRLSFLLGCVVLLSIARSSGAAIVTHTSSSTYNAAIAGRTIVTENFDSATAGTVISNGSTFADITFTYNWAGGESIRINDIADTNSGANYLGATNSTGTPVDLIADGNNITFAPTMPTSAMGLYVITADAAFDGDLTLSTTGGSVSVLAAAVEGSLPDNSQIYFLGLVEDTGAELGSFSLTASISAGAAQLRYRLDGITYAEAIPEPSSFLGCLALTPLLHIAPAARVEHLSSAKWPRCSTIVPRP